MVVRIREMRSEDARAFLEVHHAAVRGTAAKDYPQAVIEQWARLPIMDASVAGVRANPDKEVRFVAEIDGEVMGIGALVTAQNELRACYVDPAFGRQGVGRALVREIERIALQRGLTFLRTESSLTAEPFYRALGYEVRGRGEHILGSGQPMACVMMEKRLVPT